MKLFYSPASPFVRKVLVVLHETGHALGISHCTWNHCVMNGANSLRESDAQPGRLCPVCLRKLHLATGADLTDRYHALLKIRERLGHTGEAEWLKRRLAR